MYRKRVADVTKVLAVITVLLTVLLPASANSRGDDSPGYVSQQAGDPACEDNAQPLTGPRYDQADSSIVVPQRSPNRLVATWTSGPPPPPTSRAMTAWSARDSFARGRVELAQSDDSGVWTSRVLSYNAESPGIDTAENGDVYAIYTASNGYDPVDNKSYTARFSPGEYPEYRYPIPNRFVTSTLAVDQTKGDNDTLYVAGMKVERKLPLTSILMISESSGRSWRREVEFPPPLSKLAYQDFPVVASGGESVVAVWTESITMSSENYDVIRSAKVDRKTGQFQDARNIALVPRDQENQFGSELKPPSVSVVRGGRYEGRAYVVWEQPITERSEYKEIMFSYADDAASWSKPRPVGESTEPNYRVYPSVSAGPDGSAIVIWLDTRDNPDPMKSWGLMYGARIDPSSFMGRDRRLTDCPTFKEGQNWTSYPFDGLYGLSYSFDRYPDGRPVAAFPQVRTEEGDSDIYFLEPAL